MKKLFSTIFITAAIACSAPAQAADLAAGKKKAEEICAACHGVDGNSNSSLYPKLAGQWESYLVHVLKQYKNGQRNNVVMAPMAAPLSDEEIDNVAAYYASQQPALFVLPRK